ncbi:MAG TPA: acetyl-CoA carboxylase biotin carboxyl carrier protein subunit, partial [Bacteroidales bacterium]|nr:acetyl-CoA carboxylase biotin carboxyl carrier protein subunit [Bacteroidales bacterium]
FIKEVQDKKTEMERAASAKTSKENILHSPETGVVLFYSGTTYTYTGDDDFMTVGQHVKKGDILFYINTDKTYNEVASDRDGTIKNIIVKRGAKIKKGDPVVEFE